jgi:hypothetical protein
MSDQENTAAMLEKLTQLITLQQTQILAMQQSSQVTPVSIANEGPIYPNPIDVKFNSANYGLCPKV